MTVPQPEHVLKFSTSTTLIRDANTASALVAMGMTLLSTSRAPHGKINFVFHQTPALHKALGEYFRAKDLVYALRERAQQEPAAGRGRRSG